MTSRDRRLDHRRRGAASRLSHPCATLKLCSPTPPTPDHPTDPRPTPPTRGAVVDTVPLILLLLVVALASGGIAAVLARRHVDPPTDASLDRALMTATQQLVEQTEERLRSQQLQAGEQARAAQASLENLVAPLQSRLHELDGHVRSLESSRAGAYAKLDQQVADTRSLLATLQTETNHLNAALRRGDTRGRWGELQLERVIELAGMTEHVAYERQAQQAGEGTGRPDVTIHLTDGHVLYIDAKAPMDAFQDAVSASEQDTRDAHLRRHAKAMAGHVTQLHRRGYTRDERSLPFMILFVPTEASLAAAVEADARLIDTALERGIALASPTSLALMLTTISLAWRHQTFASNAHEILREVQDLHDRLGVFTEHLRKAGSSLDGAVRHYNAAIGSYETRLQPAVRSIETLAATDGAVPPLEEVTTSARSVRMPEPPDRLGTGGV